MKYKYLHKIQQVRKKYSNVLERKRERKIHYTLTWLIIAMNRMQSLIKTS